MSIWLSFLCAAILFDLSSTSLIGHDTGKRVLFQFTSEPDHLEKPSSNVLEVSARSVHLQLHVRQNNADVNIDNRSLTLWNCSKLYDSSYGYNASSCKFVRENCEAKAHLMNYLAFMKCDLPSKATVRNEQ